MRDGNPTYRGMFAVDVERSAGRGDPALLEFRQALTRMVREACAESGIVWDHAHHTDLGDGLRVVAHRDVRKIHLLHPLVSSLAQRVRRYNESVREMARIRLRMAVHAGDVHLQDGAMAGGSLELLARLLDAQPLRELLAGAPAAVTLALAVSDHVYGEVVRHGYSGVDPATYRPVEVMVKRTSVAAWLHVPGYFTGPPSSAAAQHGAGGTDQDRAYHANVIADSILVARDHAHVEEMIGRIGTRIDHVEGGVSIGGQPTPGDSMAAQIAELRRALYAARDSGRLDPDAYEAANGELHIAETLVAGPDERGRLRLVLALKRLKGLVDEVADLAAKVVALVASARRL